MYCEEKILRLEQQRELRAYAYLKMYALILYEIKCDNDMKY